jgi:hypothetical protein
MKPRKLLVLQTQVLLGLTLVAEAVNCANPSKPAYCTLSGSS